ncbi:hypothetical protein, partial [Enterococcus faecium]|uniref:hypothetical protein n=1 Tax=Enterococcus faecium TaxID=1352 RepID=UPI003919C78A
LWLKTLYRKRAVTWPFIFYTIIWTLSAERLDSSKKNREKITKEAIQDHKKENPKTKENKKFKFTKKEDLL